MMNSSAVELARAYRSIGCSWAKIGKKFGVSRQEIQRLLQPKVPAPWVLGAQAAFSSSLVSVDDGFGTGPLAMRNRKA